MDEFENGIAEVPLRKNPRIELAGLAFIFAVSGSLLWWGNKIQSAPLTLASIFLALGLIRLVLWLRGSGWHEFGLKRPRSWPKTILLAAGGLIAIFIVIRLCMPVVIRLTGQPVDRTQFDVLRGNLPALIVGLLVVWTLAAFGEELIFRGYLMNTLAGAIRQENMGWAIACLVNSVFFGIGHTYQGITGVILLGIVGLLYALFYLWSGRNLWVPILMHGLYDTTAFLVIFFSLDMPSS